MSWPTPKYHINWTTRDFIQATVADLKGDVLDFGGGTQKYRNIIENGPKTISYKVFDCANIAGVDFVGDAHNTGLESEKFDSVVCTQVLEHVEKPWIVAAEMARIMKKEGVLILSVPFMIGYHPCPHDYFRFSVEGVQALFGEFFVCQKVFTYGGIKQILCASDDFSHTYNYERFIKVEEMPKLTINQKLFKRLRSMTYGAVEGMGRQSSIYSNIGCVLIKK